VEHAFSVGAKDRAIPISLAFHGKGEHGQPLQPLQPRARNNYHLDDLWHHNGIRTRYPADEPPESKFAACSKDDRYYEQELPLGDGNGDVVLQLKRRDASGSSTKKLTDLVQMDLDNTILPRGKSH
jgi:hypothetical protein